MRATLASPIDPQEVELKDVSYFSVPEPEPRTIKKHDLVTIIVSEESEFSSKGTTDLKKSADFDAKIDAFVRFSLAKLALNPTALSSNPEIKTEGTRDFKGDGSVNRSDSFTARITAEVLDVKPNNTLVLQARQHIKTDEEEQMMILSGICRVDDITPDNTVLSTQIFDKDLTKTHKGAVNDTTKRGWVPKLLDVVNPF
jgi:flagellar L-ring protein precursor FlgH